MVYSALLPKKHTLCQPLCLGEDLLKELHHEECESGGRLQQERLQVLCPDLMDTSRNQAECCDLQWGFACVRSRAFVTGEQSRSLVPFADMANHTDAPEGPNADFRCEGISWEGSGRPAQENMQNFELVSLRACRKGDEVLISYSGKSTCQNNRRLMAQYGYFIPGK